MLNRNVILKTLIFIKVSILVRAFSCATDMNGLSKYSVGMYCIDHNPSAVRIIHTAPAA